jgi:hypothetical protein
MNILDNKLSIRFVKFKCLDTNRIYRVVESISTFDLKQPHYFDKVTECKDTVKRDDGVRKSFMRNQLKERFKNIEGIIDKY